MLDYVRSVFRIRSTGVLFALSLFSVALTLVRALVTGRTALLFLWWNLFLAFIPWSIATFIRVKEIRNRWALMLLLVVWIVFFPNAPYILTDLIHLGSFGNVPVWFDLIVLLSFAFTGMLYGFAGLHLLETRFLRRMPRLLAVAASAGLVYLSCFGIYLGRFLRWNSWDLVNNLRPVIADVVDRVTDPVTHRETWGFTLLLGTFLNMVYWSYRSFEPLPTHPRPAVRES